MDIVLAGNRTHARVKHARVKLGSLDGNHGQLFLGDGKSGFVYEPQQQSGFKVRGDVRALEVLKLGGKTGVVFGVNNGGVMVYSVAR